MEQANTDRPKARSTRKGKPPDTSSDDSYNADRGKPHWSVRSRATAPGLHSTALPPTTGVTEQHQVSLLRDTGTVPNTMRRKMVAQGNDHRVKSQHNSRERRADKTPY